MYTLEEGQKFERYRILRRLGKSCAGISYEAEDSRQQRRVTLKLIHPWSLLPDSIRRQFFRDMQVISSLAHPLLTATLNYGEMNGQLYIARYFVEHGSLLSNRGRLWFSSSLDITTAIAYVIQLAQALAHIHNHGYIHGSLTFSNILVLGAPHSAQRVPLMLSDTGLTSFVRRFGQSQATSLPITAAPEQFRNHLIPASDQYALAVLLYFWLTGHLPFLGSIAEIEHLKSEETYPSLRTLNPNIAEEHEHVIRKALSAYPKERYASIEEFAAALKKLQHDAKTPVSKQEQTLLQIKPVAHIDQKEAPLEHRQNVPSQAPVNLTAHLIITPPYTSESTIYQLVQEETTIGHAGSSDILLDQDTTTSRHHALITQINGQHFICDCRSTHGVIVNQLKLSEGVHHRLRDGDRILIGDYTLTFHYDFPQKPATFSKEHARL